ncbi:hypothetical protein ACL2XP_05455 [Sodalis sp. RH21]|uniref:hypothetical protein n=1 Tax=unclassified Sodalis (in: enterobacteria) TaxID=2636512 RepID=UPI0039B54E11
MILAAVKLTHPRDVVSAIGLALGYESDKTFSSAFKRVMYCSPRRYWRQQRRERL